MQMKLGTRVRVLAMLLLATVMVAFGPQRLSAFYPCSQCDSDLSACLVAAFDNCDGDGVCWNDAVNACQYADYECGQYCVLGG
jgi:hypothetical protein